MAVGSPRRSDTSLLSIPPICCGALQISILLAGLRDPGDPAGEGLSSLYSRREEVAEESYVWKDSDKIFAEMCVDCHGQDNIGGEIEKVEPVGVHHVAEKFRE